MHTTRIDAERPAAGMVGWLAHSFGSTFQSLENPAFARYFLGSLAFFFAMNMQIMLRGWLVWELTNDALALGMINLAFALPTLFLSPIGGVIADRFDRRTIIVVSQAIQLVLTMITTALVLVDVITYWHLLLISGLASVAGTFNMPARQAIVPDLVGRERLMNAMALNSGAMNVSRIVAPALAGVLIAPLGMGGSFTVTLMFYALAIVFFFAVRVQERTNRPPRAGFMPEMIEGLRYLGGAPAVAVLMVAGTVPMLLAMPQQILLPAFDDVFHVGATGIGLLQAAAGAGGLAGAVVAANIARPRRPALLITACMTSFGVFVVLFAVSPHIAPALVALAIGDIAIMLAMTVNASITQEMVPDQVRGRVMALGMMSFGLTPLGVLPAGAAARAFGVQATVAAGGLLLIAFALGLYLLSCSFRALDGRGGIVDVLGRSRPPAAAVADD